MTRDILVQKIVKLQSSNIVGLKDLIDDLEMSANECFDWQPNFPIDYIRLRGSHPRAAINKVFSMLGVKVTRVNRKPGNCEWKTIVHFTDFSDPK